MMQALQPFTPPHCEHGATVLAEKPYYIEGPCRQPRVPGTHFCADHQPVKDPACACGSKDGIRRFLIVSRKDLYEPEEDWVCSQCLVNDAAGFLFHPDASEGEDS